MKKTNALIRLATGQDLDVLVKLEEQAFASDRFNEEQIDYLLTRARSAIFVLENNQGVVGAAYLLWRKPYYTGRIYNIVVHPKYQGKGYGAKLLKECELECARRGSKNILLEVRVDNTGGIKFYKKHGFEIVDKLPDYYDDGTAGYKMSKEIKLKVPNTVRLKIPYYSQSLDFTCGSACLMMAFKCLNHKFEYKRMTEIALWKEATLIFMTSGIGGTDPYGLALAAQERGFLTRVLVSNDHTPFLTSVRKKKKREIIELVHENLEESALEAGVTSAVYDFAVEDIISALYRGLVPITLISTYRLTGDRIPHWVVVTGFDEKHFFIHDPDSESYEDVKTRSYNLKVTRDEFSRMSRYGKDVFRCAILVGKR